MSAESGVEALHGFIERSNANGVRISPPAGIGAFSELVALDWEADNTTGDINITTALTDIKPCQVPSGESLKSSDYWQEWYIRSGAASYVLCSLCRELKFSIPSLGSNYKRQK